MSQFFEIIHKQEIDVQKKQENIPLPIDWHIERDGLSVKGEGGWAILPVAKFEVHDLKKNRKWLRR